MAYRIERSEDVGRDLEAIFDFLVKSYRSLGDSAGEALDRAADRIHGIEDTMESLGDFPYRDVSCADVLAGVRNLTRDGSILYYEIREDERLVRVLAVFLAGQEHQRRALLRLARPRV